MSRRNPIDNDLDSSFPCNGGPQHLDRADGERGQRQGTQACRGTAEVLRNTGRM